VEFWDLLRALDSRQIEARTESPSLKAVVDEILAAKHGAGRSPRYVDSLRIILGQFVSGRGSLPIASLTLADVERWLDSKNSAGRATYKARLSSLFAFAIRRRYRHDNPCDAEEAPTLRALSPAIFTVRQDARCLATLRRSLVRLRLLQFKSEGNRPAGSPTNGGTASLSSTARKPSLT